MENFCLVCAFMFYGSMIFFGFGAMADSNIERTLCGKMLITIFVSSLVGFCVYFIHAILTEGWKLL